MNSIKGPESSKDNSKYVTEYFLSLVLNNGQHNLDVSTCLEASGFF